MEVGEQVKRGSRSYFGTSLNLVLKRVTFPEEPQKQNKTKLVSWELGGFWEANVEKTEARCSKDCSLDGVWQER